MQVMGIEIKDDVILPKGTDKTNLEEVISNYILARNGEIFLAGEKAIEAHKIYRLEEKNGILIAYMQVKFNWFGFENGAFTIKSGTGDEGIPVRRMCLLFLMSIRIDSTRYTLSLGCGEISQTGMVRGKCW